jgi:hypothetical protein
MYAKLEFNAKILSENDKEIILLFEDEEKRFVVKKSSSLYNSITKSLNNVSNLKIVTKTEICNNLDAIRVGSLFHCSFEKEEDKSIRKIHCQKIKCLSDGRILVVDLEEKEVKSFYKNSVLTLNHKSITYSCK